MSDRPIIFSAPMVRALIEGRKTQTRRVLRNQPVSEARFQGVDRDGLALFTVGCFYGRERLPYATGDRLYVREAWRSERGLDRRNATEIEADCLGAGYSRVWAPIAYEADASRVNFENGMVAGRYRHARFMPRWASRLTLTVSDVRVQRLQEISEDDAVAEGAFAWCRECGGPTALPEGCCYSPNQSYCDGLANVWCDIHGPNAWDENPWCVAISFTVKKGNIDAL